MTRKLRSLELAMKNFQGLRGYKSISYKDLCMFLGVYLPFGFKMSKFKKYEGHGDPVAYLTHYYNQLRGAGGNEELIMAYFGESFSGLAQLRGAGGNEELIMAYFELIPDEKSLTNMKKKRTESFTEYAIQWREQAVRVKPPIKERKIVEVFIQAQDETYYQHLLPTLGKPFIAVLKMGEMIEDGIKIGRIIRGPEPRWDLTRLSNSVVILPSVSFLE
ncbi:hypothetical protein BC332_14976 [Capsicum chinense]|nr:hypothetical protein BC332_14976 [Capsicum chinense]